MMIAIKTKTRPRIGQRRSSSSWRRWIIRILVFIIGVSWRMQQRGGNAVVVAAAPSQMRRQQTTTAKTTTKVKASSDSGSQGGGGDATTMTTTTTPETPMTSKVEVSSDGSRGGNSGIGNATTTADPETTTSTTTTTTTTTTATATQQQQTNREEQQRQQQQQQPTLMLVCTTDGRIYSMDAWTGEYHSDTFEQAAGPPLMTRSQAPPVVDVEDDAEMIQQETSSSSSSGPSDVDDDSTTQSSSSRSSSSSASSMIIPGMDGRLYWQQPVAAEESSSFELQIQELPLTIHNLLSQPVRTCPDAGESHYLDQQCGVLSATAHTSFLALSERGELLWKSNFDATTTARQGAAGENAGPPSNGENNNNVLILQRKDYWIQEVSMATGQLKWNASVGSYRAVVFDEEVDLDEYDDEEEDDDEDEEYDDDDELAEEEEADDDKVLSLPPAEKNGRRGKAANGKNEGGVNAALPAVFFSNRGRSVSAVNPDTMEVLWSSDFIQNSDDAADTTVIAAVFGIYKGEWRDLVVLDSEEDDDEEGDEEQEGDGVIPANRQLPAKAVGQKESREFDYFDYFGIDEDDYGDDGDDTTTSSRTSSLYAKQLSKLQQQHLVRLRQKPEQRQCPGASLRTSTGECVLTLPAASQQQQQRPRQQEETATTTVAQQPEGGLFLSWSTVICLVVFGVVLIVAVVVLVVRAVLRRQRREEEKNAKAGNSAAATTPNTSSSTAAENSNSERSSSSSSTAAAKASRLLSSHSLPPGDDVDHHPKAMKRSSSLPGFIRNSNGGNNNGDLHQTESLRRILPSSQDGDDAKGELAKDSARRPSPDGALGTDKQQQQQQTVVMSPAGIPLIKYSRYATEFEQVRPLGRGGFGTVFECKNALDGRSYAMKKVYIEGTAGTIQSRLQRVLREVKILAMLDHPHIVRYYTAWLEFEEEDDRQRRAQQTNSSSGLQETDRLSSRPKRALRRFSSSFLCTDNDNQNSATVSEWTVDQERQSSQQQFATQHRRRFSNSTFQEWSTTKESLRMNHDDEEESDSWLPPGRQAYVPPPPAAYNNSGASDCGIYFADSETNGDDCDADGSGKEKRQDEEEKTVCFSPSRGGGGGENGRSEKRSTRVEQSSNAAPAKKGANTGNNRNGVGVGNDDDSTTLVRYTLYIQMQLCSQKTVADFLARTRDRMTPGGVVDAQTALGLFFQIVQAVEHVHKQGLIHRDLKPSNCFMDEAGNVKVGDFGLSRETSGGGCGAAADNSETPTPRMCDSFEMMTNGGAGDYDLNHTAGVGTRSYASPEQMKGSDYDSMTDIYSLGIMLFELCFPMSTGMERNIVLGKLRGGGGAKEGQQQQQPQFPPTWHSVVGGHFPALQELISSMLQHDPARRPAAAAVAGAVHSVLGEFTIVSIDRNHRQNPNVILLRIETEDRPSALSDACAAIREDASSPHYEVDIVQYGLRTGTSASATASAGGSASSSQQQQAERRREQRPTTAIMEFAIQQKRIRRSRRCRRRQEDQNGDDDNDDDDEEEEEEEEEECGGGGLGTRAMQIVAKLNRRPAIRIARQVSHCSSGTGGASGSSSPRHVRASSSAGGSGGGAAAPTTAATTTTTAAVS